MDICAVFELISKLVELSGDEVVGEIVMVGNAGEEDEVIRVEASITNDGTDDVPRVIPADEMAGPISCGERL